MKEQPLLEEEIAETEVREAHEEEVREAEERKEAEVKEVVMVSYKVNRLIENHIQPEIKKKIRKQTHLKK